MMNDLSTLEAPIAGDSNPLIHAEESILVDQARDGDAEAFEQLVQPQMSKAYRVALRITGNREDAEDAIQQALLKAYAHIDQFHSKSRFSTWLLRITINEALGKLRKLRAENAHLSHGSSVSEDGADPVEMIRAKDDARPEMLYVQAREATAAMGSNRQSSGDVASSGVAARSRGAADERDSQDFEFV